MNNFWYGFITGAGVSLVVSLTTTLINYLLWKGKD